ncbi:cell division inhibitor protein [Escherichia coli]|uniref:Cell division inhibitor protein n=1 Tax=Escherichia coli O8 TaxID=1010796 RepID=A0A9P2I5M9_ECOLX|nr:cell division inhibitor protein [Escherichia coli]EFO2014067.1 cell division inhibitor protein [Escherichia coli O8]EFA3940495.1 cell division inhibitor protein [Escherichia coli]EFO2024365.1 cell division inhibitor protein [Escherichia coli O8]EFO2033531.1 cell division inhibitor protein [Escherichia coli O8]
MKHQHYGTQEVIRQCATPGTMVRYKDRVYRATANTRGKLVMTNMRDNITVRDYFVEILLDGKGNPLIN